ncbi:MAG: Na(+)/H(+) antiporter subunit C [Syntrophomonadaceae bacterium]|nr:Na(+)/H(+) antiporter subunit C [Bacillota bacterium]
MERLLHNYPYMVAVVLFVLGVYTILSQENLMKKIIGTNIMSSAIFLLFISAGNIAGGSPPIISKGYVPPEGVVLVNPLPAALILTGIVVSFSLTAFALSIVIKLHDYYGTIEADEILKLRSEL